jgi:hypothetical protein
MTVGDCAARMNVVVVGPNGWVEVREALETSGRHTALGFHQRWWEGVRFFHRDGQVYEIESAQPDRPLGPLSGFLARTVYNPWIHNRYGVRAVGTYELSDLRSLVASAIRSDDDILTQFRDAPDLLDDLSRAAGFSEVAETILSGTHGSGVV